VTPAQLVVEEHPAIVIKVAIKKLIQPGYMEWVEGTNEDDCTCEE